MNMCDWRNLPEEIARLVQFAEKGIVGAAPFSFLALTDSPKDHQLCARAWASAHFSRQASPRKSGRQDHGKIRLGYASTDFRGHAISYLVAELIELHDREQFEVVAFSLGPDDKSGMRGRLENAFDRFVDGWGIPDAQVVDAIAESEIDILVDLNGFTRGARSNIFAPRPAPIQVNYLGYPGTMAASCFDYIIGDGTVFEPQDERYYAEKLVRLPHCYQPNDRKRRVADAVFSRKQAGLPEDGFVFACFNNAQKILPGTFDSWMRILDRVHGSVLWLFSPNASAKDNLKQEASKRGINPGRLVFAGRLGPAEHLARHALADLFLDTLPYNAHTTASDALWTGLPVLTQKGKSFPARVAASLLNAIGLPELIAHSGEEYEDLAVELAHDRGKLSAIRAKLADNRLTTPLFDAPLYTRHLEQAYAAMHKRHRDGLPPDHIEII